MNNELRGCITNYVYVVLFSFLVMYLGCVQYLHYNNDFLYYGCAHKYCVRALRGYILLPVFNFLCIPFKQHYLYSMCYSLKLYCC